MTTRRLAAILAADVVGFSSMMEKDEEGTLRRVKALQREVIEPKVRERGGRLVKTTGDGFLCEFGSPVEAVRCALEVQEATKANGSSDLLLRMGVNLGDIIVEPDGDIYGDGVNVAARLEQMAEPGGLCISGSVHEHAEGKVAVQFESRGEQQVKNITRPVMVYALRGARSSWSEPNALPLPDKPSIAVLPFTNMSDDRETDYFADGVVEDIITALSRVRWFFVIARNSSFVYKGRAVDVRQVGRELGVRYVLEGSIRKAANRIRITGQLVEAATGTQIWGNKFDGDMEGVFDLQDQITSNVVRAIEPSLRSTEIERSRRKRTGDVGAYDLFLRALAELYTYSDDGLLRADALLREAISLDPNYSDAWATLANTIFLRRVGGFLSPDEALQPGSEAAHRAVKADPQNPSALATAAAALAVLGGNLDQAVEFADQALTLAPNSAPICSFCALTYNFNGEFEKALALLHLARRTSPLDPRAFAILSQIAHAHFFSRRFEDAVFWATRCIEQHPGFTPPRRYLASALAHLGRLPEAKEAVRELLQVQPNSTLSLSAQNRWRYPWMVDLYVEGLREAGLPE